MFKIQTDQHIVWNEKFHEKNNVKVFTKFDTLIAIAGQTKICYSVLESCIYYPELKFSWQ